ncbi:MAG: hypothetical protein FWG74_02375, partial [Planctomycetes bacterium]|nr:hypothetical protein [Planctomycetota bacterium]
MGAPSMKRRRIAIFLFLPFTAFLASAAEPNLDPFRERLARTIYRHDFENRRDPDTGLPALDSASLANDGWPDFWEPIRAIGFPEYLISEIFITSDSSGQIPGAYRDVPNQVLRLGYDGTKVGVKTRIPVPIDSALAYEFSLLARDSGLEGARIRAGIEWLRIDPMAVDVLRIDEIPDLPTGQIDWPVSPARLQVNDLPAGVNAAKFFVIIERDPASVGGAYHGELRLDNITLRPLPRIIINPLRVTGGNRIIPVSYTGLTDNLPDPANPGFFRGRRYSRRVEVTDILNQPISLDGREFAPVEADDAGVALEEMPFPRSSYGVYYLNIRLYDAADRLAADVIRAVAVMRPEQPVDALTRRSGKPVFAIASGEAPVEILRSPARLGRLLSRAGAKLTKIIPWRNSYSGQPADDEYYRLLAETSRELRLAGIGVIGTVRPPTAMFDSRNLAQVLVEDADRLASILSEAGRHIGLFMDGWQLGDDADGSLAGFPAGRDLEKLSNALTEFSGGLPITLTRRVGMNSTDRFPFYPSVAGVFFPDSESAISLWPGMAALFPWLYEPYYN